MGLLSRIEKRDADRKGQGEVNSSQWHVDGGAAMLSFHVKPRVDATCSAQPDLSELGWARVIGGYRR